MAPATPRKKEKKVMGTMDWIRWRRPPHAAALLVLTVGLMVTSGAAAEDDERTPAKKSAARKKQATARKPATGKLYGRTDLKCLNAAASQTWDTLKEVGAKVAKDQRQKKKEAFSQSKAQCQALREESGRLAAQWDKVASCAGVSGLPRGGSSN